MGTLQIELFRSKEWNVQISDTKSGTVRNCYLPFPFEQANGKHVSRTIAFPSEHKTKLVCNRSAAVRTTSLSVPEIGARMEQNDCASV